MEISPFAESDIDGLVAILRENNQYAHPAVEGPEAMRRVAACGAALFLVAREGGRPVGLVRGVYDGSRAMIHLLSVRRDRRGEGTGTALAEAAIRELRERGAPTVSVTATESSRGFWERLSFAALPVFLMLKTD